MASERSGQAACVGLDWERSCCHVALRAAGGPIERLTLPASAEALRQCKKRGVPCEQDQTKLLVTLFESSLPRKIFCSVSGLCGALLVK